MKLALAVALLIPAFVLGTPSAPEVVTVAVGADRATGFVAGDGRVVTVAHVLGDAPIVVDGRPATVLRADRRLDLAVLRVPGLEGAAPRIAPGDLARIVTPDGDVQARLVRRIEARLDGANQRSALELRADVAVGDSGAPVLTSAGAVAGIVFARSRTRDGTAYAVDAEVLGTLRPLD